MIQGPLAELAGTSWTGTKELWLDRAGNDASRSECALRIDADALRYTWSHEGKTHEGTIVPNEDGVTWSDSFHQKEPVKAARIEGAWGLLAYHFTWGPADEPWGWRTVVSRRPSGELVVQMTNITPWGEETRAVRMVLAQKA